MDKIKEYNKSYFHQCPLCLKEVKANDEFIITITKGVLKRHFAHTSCFNKLLKGEDKNERRYTRKFGSIFSKHRN